jgi:SRSO17 transposase
VTGDFVVFTQKPQWLPPVRPGNGRPQTRPRLAPGTPRPVALNALAQQVRRKWISWREGTRGKLSGRFAWLRVWPGHGWATGACADAAPVWLLIEEQAGGAIRYAFSNLPARTSRLQAVRLWKSRWPVEQGYQQLKEELGLDHFEGRSWRGFHHHAAMTLLAYGFLLLERHHAEQTRPRRGKKGVPSGPDR